MGFILLCWFSVFPFLWRFVLLCLSKLKESPVLHKPWNGNVGILSSILPCSYYTAVVLSRQISCWISSIYHSYWNSTMHPVTMLHILELLWFCYSLQKNAAWRKFTALNTNVSLPAVSIRVDPAMGLFSKCLLCYRKKRSVAPTAKRGDGKAESHSATALGFR